MKNGVQLKRVNNGNYSHLDMDNVHDLFMKFLHLCACKRNSKQDVIYYIVDIMNDISYEDWKGEYK